MSYVLIHADAAATLVRDDPIVPAADLPAFSEARTLLEAAAAIRDAAAADARTAADAAREEARAAGHAEGLATGAAQVRDELLRLAAADTARAAAQRDDLARLALEVVRRIAADLGPGDMVAALADRAAASVAPDPLPVVRVHPDAVAAATARLGLRARVEGDSRLAPDDCVLATPLGEVHAGLETQLSALSRAWGIAG
ncbi:FliH/SctL family protein [uncultured Sphingomonas sp.]|uniref:FliH/SctL family protein n=1 Tax=uncultured Sphingomonas sp. TaxID=158754 RepID=UPI002584DAC2|nr:FliH/SctL family protein [uncultured Sphingomonas sp.]